MPPRPYPSLAISKPGLGPTASGRPPRCYVAALPEHEPQQFRACDVCGRTLLRGESATEYLTTDRERQMVCALCLERAEDAGWIRADSPAAASAPEAPRRRRSLRGLNLRERAARAGERVRSAGSQPDPPRDEPDSPQDEPAPAPAPPEPETPERRMRRALERFNSSDQTRVVAGLNKSLGTPQAAVRELEGGANAEITVAWDLSWYRWELAPEGEEDPRRVGKGSEVSELGEEMDWNAAVDAEGRVRWRESS